MFNINNPQIHADFPYIVDSYLVLHFDEAPILFTGYNKYGDRVIASSVELDMEVKKERFFHVIITTEMYNDFIHRKITYLQILREAASIFVIDESFNKTSIETYMINTNEIPTEYLPSENSYCPEIEFIPSYDYSIGLSGKKAHENKANYRDINEISKNFSGVVDSCFKIIQTAGIEPIVSNRPYTTGSFKINFNIELKPIKGDRKIFEDKDSYNRFLKDFLDYCLNNLNDEINNILEQKNLSEKLNDLISDAKLIYHKLGFKIEETFQDNFLKEIINTASKLGEISDTIGENFTAIGLANIAADGNEYMLGVFDENFKSSIGITLENIENKTQDILIDEEPKEYKILVYHLNTDSRTGNAWINKIGKEDEYSKPKIYIKGESPLSESTFTESLHLNKFITVKGIARRDGINFKRIDIEYD